MRLFIKFWEITGLQNSKFSMREIARKINRSFCVVQSYFRNPEEYGTNKRSRAKRKLSPRAEGRISRAASNSSISLTGLQALVEENVSRTTIWRSLNRNENIRFEQQKQVPKLTNRHKEARVAFWLRNIASNWNTVSYMLVQFRNTVYKGINVSGHFLQWEKMEPCWTEWLPWLLARYT